MNEDYTITKEIIYEKIKEDFFLFVIYAFHAINGSKFLPNWHIEYIAKVLSAQEKKRLIINIAPRHLKTEICSIMFPVWILGNNPEKRIIGVTYSMQLICRYARDIRRIMASGWYQELFPKTKIDKKNNRKNNVVTTENGYYYGTSINGTLTGEGGDLIIIDDPHNPIKMGNKNNIENTIDWFNKVLLTRCNNVDAMILLVMQRICENDLTDYLINQKSEKWHNISIPIISEEDCEIIINNKIFHKRKIGELLHKERMDYEYVQKLKESIGEYVFNAQYQQKPSAKKNSLIKEKYLKTFSHQEKKFQKYYISIDAASNTQENNDYSVILIFAIENFNLYVVEVLRKKLEYSQLKNELLNCIKQYNPINILIENKGSGICLIQDFKRNHNIKAINPKGSKEDRLLRRLYFFEQEMVFLNKEMKEIEEFKKELISFPKVKHDDQLDALVQAIEFTASIQDLNNKVRVRSIAL